jgi:hypothetical protein
VAVLDADTFVAEVQKVRGKRQPLSAAAEARQLEARVADLVNAAYGLTLTRSR